MINLSTLNGHAAPNWVLRTLAAATAAAFVAGVAPTRVTYAAAYQDAAVEVTLTQLHTIAAKASRTARASASAVPNANRSGAARGANSTATGYAFLVRQAWADAGADATCTAQAFTAQAIGTAQASAVSAVDLAFGHVVHPGKARTTVSAQAAASADVKRYSGVSGELAGALHGWGEASFKAAGTYHYQHDGFALATASVTPHLDPLQVRTIVTKPATHTTTCSSQVVATLRLPARAMAQGTLLGVQSAAGDRVRAGKAQAMAVLEADVTPVRVRTGSLSASAGAALLPLLPWVTHASQAQAPLSQGISLPVPPLRTAMTTVLGSLCQATLIHDDPGVQYAADMAYAAQASSGLAIALMDYQAHGLGAGTAWLQTATLGKQHNADSLAESQFYELAAHSNVAYAAQVAGDSMADHVASGFARQLRGEVLTSVHVYGLPPAILTNYACHSYGVGVTDLVTTTLGTQHYANSEAASVTLAEVDVPQHNYACHGLGHSGSELVRATLGTQHFADSEEVTVTSAAVGVPQHNYAGRSLAIGTSSLIRTTFGTQHFAQSGGFAGTGAIVDDADQNHAGHAHAQASAALILTAFGDQVFADVDAYSTAAAQVRAWANYVATIAVVDAVLVHGSPGGINQPTGNYMSTVTHAPVALAWVGKALPFANSDVVAPEDRYLKVAGDLRDMAVPSDDRLMRVT